MLGQMDFVAEEQMMRFDREARRWKSHCPFMATVFVFDWNFLRNNCEKAHVFPPTELEAYKPVWKVNGKYRGLAQYQN